MFTSRFKSSIAPHPQRFDAQMPELRAGSCWRLHERRPGRVAGSLGSAHLTPHDRRCSDGGCHFPSRVLASMVRACLGSRGGRGGHASSNLTTSLSPSSSLYLRLLHFRLRVSHFRLHLGWHGDGGRLLSDGAGQVVIAMGRDARMS